MITEKKSQKLPPIKVNIREITKDEDWEAIYPLIRQLNKKLGKRRYYAMLEEMRCNGYRCAGAFYNGTIVGVVGIWMNTRFWCGRYIDLDNVVVDAQYRGHKIGEQLVRWAERFGKRNGCNSTVLDCYTSSKAAQRFYFREGYSILGFHFVKEL